IHCPLTNNRYASHLEKLSRYLDAGITIALGTDSFPPDLVRAIDAGAQLAKAQHANLAAHLLAEYFEAATLGGARALRRPDLGRIAAGASADVVAFGLDDIRMGPVEDPLRTLVLAGTARDSPADDGRRAGGDARRPHPRRGPRPAAPRRSAHLRQAARRVHRTRLSPGCRGAT